ncbi:mitochondrial carrier domain-containing protein [Tribonema minus]|uniref:Mitochondrial carrier domain-containing protein n=1 Tax=Tribonema minus TaxID=303371 RepID=A0A835ZPC0_9STRA|nr:mitochondrial carrier domain-containing protein [Tribonema minus]|eukprot:TRINITY_DN6181_c0_g1_i1.p1 TRINITY_DN6181_c0_g1~~TRINITY_DN6181_c0_g1_i1.p1  ORF type:complete len:316 (+),score=98.40 TRINITY_DN6181_c0_g1_i1:69-950(+)
MASASSQSAPSASEVLNKALRKALGGGLAGASAMVMNVGTLMWLRTAMNYQYRHGTSTRAAITHLYKEGGIPRFYRGVVPALVQGPLSRFGDTAANTGVLALLESMDSTKGLPVGVKTLCASGAAALWRIVLMPIDTTKTIMQVEGKNGFPALKKKFKANGPSVLYHGAIAASAATFVGHYPWFFTYNYLQERIPKETATLRKLARNAVIGFASSLVSDTCSNSIRVIKVYKQSSTEPVTYLQAAKNVIASDGVLGLFGRGLKTKLIANGMQGLMFSVFWKFFEEQFNGPARR